MDLYEQIFKRKSFHLFKNTRPITEEELKLTDEFIKNLTPLRDDIKTEIKITPQSETSCKRGAEYCILFYSENKEGFLQNIGYIGEQLDLYLASLNIGALWYGAGKPKDAKCNELDFVIMMAIAGTSESSFRKDMFKAKRLPFCETWQGKTLKAGEIARFSPSACNTQPWRVNCSGEIIEVNRYKKPGKRGIMPAAKVSFYNRIDMGIYLFILETCLKHSGLTYKRTLFCDSNDEVDSAPTAKYELLK